MLQFSVIIFFLTTRLKNGCYGKGKHPSGRVEAAMQVVYPPHPTFLTALSIGNIRHILPYDVHDI